jgi:SAM-dependent methyltransferase
MYRGGYGNLMSDAIKLLDGSAVYGKDIQRNGYYVSVGSSAATSSMCDATPLAVLSRLKAKTVVDLGCGGGAFLIGWANLSPDNHGIGVDIDPHGLEAAKGFVAQARLSDRIQLVLGDGFDLRPVAAQIAKADVIYSFAMEHEMLRAGEEAVLNHIDGLAEMFPGKRYLLGEPILHINREDAPFYWLHVLSKQGIPRNIQGWIPLLKRLKKARLEAVYVPDHERIAAYFDIAL